MGLWRCRCFYYLLRWHKRTTKPKCYANYYAEILVNKKNYSTSWRWHLYFWVLFQWLTFRSMSSQCFFTSLTLSSCPVENTNPPYSTFKQHLLHHQNNLLFVMKLSRCPCGHWVHFLKSHNRNKFDRCRSSFLFFILQRDWFLKLFYFKFHGHSSSDHSKSKHSFHHSHPQQKKPGLGKVAEAPRSSW